MNKELLRSIMGMAGDTDASMAEYLGISQQTFVNKLNEDGTEFTLLEIRMIANRYWLDNELVDRIFFAD